VLAMADALEKIPKSTAPHPDAPDSVSEAANQQ